LIAKLVDYRIQALKSQDFTSYSSTLSDGAQWFSKLNVYNGSVLSDVCIRLQLEVAGIKLLKGNSDDASKICDDCGPISLTDCLLKSPDLSFAESSFLGREGKIWTSWGYQPNSPDELMGLMLLEKYRFKDLSTSVLLNEKDEVKVAISLVKGTL
jgi:hypothetical protein